MARTTRAQMRRWRRRLALLPPRRALTEEAADNTDAMVEMHAFDQLPPVGREALRATPYGASARMFLARLARGESEAQLLAFLEACTGASRREAVKRGVPAGAVAMAPSVGGGREAGGRRVMRLRGGSQVTVGDKGVR
jgi:hypothetical protein